MDEEVEDEAQNAADGEKPLEKLVVVQPVEREDIQRLQNKFRAEQSKVAIRHERKLRLDQIRVQQQRQRQKDAERKLQLTKTKQDIIEFNRQIVRSRTKEFQATTLKHKAQFELANVLGKIKDLEGRQ